MQLSDQKEKFSALGVNIVAMTYDDQKGALKFSRKHKIAYPILQDVDQKHVRQLGILNTEYAPGHWAYGIPYPGMVLVDAKGNVFAKFSEAGYKNRPAISLVLEAAKRMRSVQSSQSVQ